MPSQNLSKRLHRFISSKARMCSVEIHQERLICGHFLLLPYPRRGAISPGPACGRGSIPLAQCTAVSPRVNFMGNDQMLLWYVLCSHLLATRAPTCVFALKTQPHLNSAVTTLGTTDVKSFPFVLLLPIAAFSSLQLFYNIIASKCSFA